MRVLLVLLISSLSVVNSITLCNQEVKSKVTASYSCFNENETCCPEGCCTKPFVLPLVSIAVAAKICILVLFVFFAAGVVKCFQRGFQYLRQHHLGYQKGSLNTTNEKNKQNHTEMVTIKMPNVTEESSNILLKKLPL